jgi:hypothetical protein
MQLMSPMPAQDFLTDYWDILVFVEGSIYQLDEDNEELTAQQTGCGTLPLQPGEPCSMTNAL